jgi:transposase-like protein
MSVKEFKRFAESLSKLSKIQLEQVLSQLRVLSKGETFSPVVAPEGCPKCSSPFAKNGTSDGKQRYRCKCGYEGDNKYGRFSALLTET